ncbi:hypothetical protein C1H46_029715 [Malus baccata]|uniref:At1g61320/AtMIF1 LRR domain-containing protein n=1 Tax=Malus baccata TaxID=106549 RepID=A0A540LE34_MALBA|nr:hypothetical protein C1H46_029715 [Malus baccata]
MKIWALRRFWLSMRKPKLLEMKRKRLISSGNEEQGHSPPTKCETIGKDGISNLPDDVLHTIISLLSTREAVVSFKVLCFFPSMYVLQVNDWIDFAIGKGVEDLDLAFTCDNTPKCAGWSSVDYFPAQILLNDEKSKLRRLSFRGCMLKSNFTTGFRTLSTLVLCGVNLAGHVEPHMFSSCMNFEHLTLQRCFGLERLCIGDSLQCLKALVVIRCEGLKGIELMPPTLPVFITRVMKSSSLSNWSPIWRKYWAYSYSPFNEGSGFKSSRSFSPLQIVQRSRNPNLHFDMSNVAIPPYYVNKIKCYGGERS